MICGYCRQEFSEGEGEAACANCPLHDCGLVRCPKCGYETPREPKWIAWFKKRGRKKAAR
jgi:hypothetical protein